MPVFKAEICAILACVKEYIGRGYIGKHNYICSHSSAGCGSMKVDAEAHLGMLRGIVCMSGTRLYSSGSMATAGFTINEEVKALAMEGLGTPFLSP
jgi:hypothetical protein